MKILILNWASKAKGAIGGVESVFDQLGSVLGARVISAPEAHQVLNIQPLSEQYYRFANIDRSIVLADYMKKYDEFFDVDLVISAGDCGGFLDINAPIVAYYNNPYLDVAEQLFRHGFYSLQQLHEFGRVYVLMQQLLSKKSVENVTVSNYMKQYLYGIHIEPSTVIEHGVDTKLFSPMDKEDMRQKYGLPKGTIGMWAGAFHAVKNYHTVAQLAKDFPDIHWLLLFKHPVAWKPHLKNVTIMQTLPRELLPELYSAADFLLNPSIVESFGLHPVEAMACNCPVIVSKTGFAWDLPEGKFDGGYVVKWNDKTKLFESVHSFVQRNTKSVFEPRKYVLEKEYTIERWSKSWKEKVKSLLKR